MANVETNTCQMKILNKSNGQSSVQVHRRGVEFKPDIMLLTTEDVDSAITQKACLALEIFVLIAV